MRLSFRDPDGSLSDDGSSITRRVQPAARERVRELLASPLYDTLCKDGLLVPAEQVQESDNGGLTMTHPRVTYPSYPFEWTPGMLGQAAQLTLEIQARAWQAGWTLKDASASNVLFEGTRAVFCDLLSLRKREASDPPGWEAYGQFVRHFVLPLLVIREHGRLPRDIFLAHRDGLRALDVVPSLRWYRHWSLSMLLHVRLPSWLERRRGSKAPSRQGQVRRADSDATPWLLANLGRCIAGLVPKEQSGSAWSDYTTNRDHYETKSLARKHAVVRDLFERRRFGQVLDIGANTGEFSTIALEHGAQVVAIDDDIRALDQLYRRDIANSRPLHCLHVNLARPSPATGWQLTETLALPERLRQRFDLVLMLAVVHHLVVTERLPLHQIFDFVADCCTGTLLVEFVDRQDPRFIELAGRNLSLYTDWTREHFAAIAGQHFEILAEHSLTDHRILFELRKRAP